MGYVLCDGIYIYIEGESVREWESLDKKSLTCMRITVKDLYDYKGSSFDSEWEALCMGCNEPWG